MPIPRLLALLLPLLLTACDDGVQTADPQVSFAAAAVDRERRPIGPVPGPAEHPPPRRNPYADDEVALREGRRLFVAFNCYGCHGGHGGGGMGPSLRDVEWRYGGDAPAIFDSIAEGRQHGMPAWGGMLPEQQIWKIAAYVESMDSPLEPSPPR